jgi:hypothetical protein
LVVNVEGNWLDEAWNDILIQCADDAIAFFMPRLAADRDYSKAAELLSEDMPLLKAETNKGKRFVDVCFSVHMSGGGVQRAALIVEQQHRNDPDFARRVYTTFYRASDRLLYPVTSLAILTGRGWSARPYEYECYGTKLYFEYNIYSVAEADIDALRRDERPFAVVVLAAALMLEAGGDPNDREKYARELLGLMMERNYDKHTRKMFFNFVRRVFRIQDDDMSPEIKEEWNMRAIPVQEAARLITMRQEREEARERGLEEGLEKGKAEGMEKGRLSVARLMRSDGLPIETIKKYTGLSESEILQL